MHAFNFVSVKTFTSVSMQQAIKRLVRFLFVQGTRSANEVVIMTVHDIGCDRK